MQLVKRTATIVFFLTLSMWVLFAAILGLSYLVFLCNTLVIAVVSYNLFAPRVSRYFRLITKTKHERHLQKKAVRSLWLFSFYSPHVALRKLHRDMVDAALCRAMSRIPKGGNLVIETHFFSPKLLDRLLDHPLIFALEYQEMQLGKCSAILIKASAWLSASVRFLLGKGRREPRFQAWHRVVIQKQEAQQNQGTAP